MDQAHTPKHPPADVVVRNFLLHASTVVYARLAGDGQVQESNPALARFLGAAPDGRRLSAFVVDGQRALVERLTSGETPPPDGALFLHVSRGNESPETLKTWWSRDDAGVVMMGEVPATDDARMQASMGRLNTRITELSRENVKKSSELEKALQDLREAQGQLVHREKMASLGQMTAGVAHEINNPVAFVLNNQYVLQRDVDDLLTLLNLFGDGLDVLETAAPELYQGILDKIAEVDLPHLAESVPRLLTSSREGLERVRDIVQDLRLFSRLDESEIKSADINDSVRTSLRFLSPLVRQAGVAVTERYGSLPAVVCRPGHLGQVFSNLLSNAIQAARTVVTVETRLEDGLVLLEVADDGPGIPADALPHIFEPFFTTKPVGQGTGLGLSIAHTVVEEHGGSIGVETSPASGTRFTVTIPVVLEENPRNAKGGVPDAAE